MDDQDPPTMGDALSKDQEKVLILLQIFSAFLSVMGSSTIVFKILRETPSRPYDRVMLGLSSCDIIASTIFATNEFFVPRDTGAVWAFGNQATCQASGFIAQLSFSAWWYNCILSYYFLLTVVSQVKQKNYVKRYERWLHLSAIFFPITAIMGLLRGWYDKQDLGACWIMDPTIRWIVAGIPSFFTYLSLIINNIVIYAIVKKTFGASEDVNGLTLRQRRLKRESTTQMYLYVTSFFVSVSPSIAKQIWEAYSGTDNIGKIYPLLVAQAITLPLQGFFNSFIYIKPVYRQFRVANPNKPIRYVLHQALFNSTTPRVHHRRIANHVTDGGDTMSDISSRMTRLGSSRHGAKSAFLDAISEAWLPPDPSSDVEEDNAISEEDGNISRNENSSDSDI